MNIKSMKSGDVGAAPNLKQKIGDACTWVIKTECDAPVLFVPSTSDNLDSMTPEWNIQILEYSYEYL